MNIGHAVTMRVFLVSIIAMNRLTGDPITSIRSARGHGDKPWISQKRLQTMFYIKTIRPDLVMGRSLSALSIILQRILVILQSLSCKLMLL